MAPGMQALDDEMEYLAAEYEYRCLVGYNGPPNRKWALQGAIARAQARVDAAVWDSKLLDERLLELANILDGTTDPVEYMRPHPPPPPPMRPRPPVDNAELNDLLQQMAEQARRPK